MYRIIWALAVLFSLTIPQPTWADEADIAAAARGVVRVIVIATDGETRYPLSHGSGFAISPDTIVTNNHVVEELRLDPTLQLMIVPPEAGEPVPARVLAYSPVNDLALIKATQPLNLPPLTIAGARSSDSAEVSAVGYPMIVDRAQGLEIEDIFRPQPPVKSRGFLSGQRPSKDFDTVLHTAPIASGNSGGPLLDKCGRVLGVNSFGADSQGADAEFFFAVTMRELLPFLRANGVAPRVIAQPCRSLAELDAEEREAAQRQELLAQQRQEREQAQLAERRAVAERDAMFSVLAERESGLALALISALVALALLYLASKFRLQSREKEYWAQINAGHALTDNAEEASAEALKRAQHLQYAAVAAAIGATILFIVAINAWLSRPGFEDISERASELMVASNNDTSDPITGESAASGKLICTVQPNRSRITSADTSDLPLEWASGGCVNGRTQYGFAKDQWKRVFVPNQEQVVSVNSYDPASGEYRIERYLLSRQAIEAAREARGKYRAPSCDAGESAAMQLGEAQQGVLSQLPDRPNERIVYACVSDG